jgi:MFS family permease
MAVGMVSMAIPSFADERHNSGIAGILFAVWGVGSVAGGLWCGRSDTARSAEARFATLLWFFAAGTALPILAWDPWSLGATLAMGGTAIAPLTAVEYALVQEFVPPEALAEGFSWVASLNVLASAVGSQLAGTLMEHGSLRLVFAAGAAAGGWAAAVPARRLCHRSTAAT